MSRQPKMYGVFAKPGAGKSTKLIQMINARLSNGDRTLVVDPDGCEPSWDKFTRYDSMDEVPNDFTGVAVVMYEEKKTFAEIKRRCVAKELVDFMLVLDDANSYAHPTPEPELKYLITRKRQFGMDILITAHGWGQCPNVFLQFIDIYVLGPTDSSPHERISVLTKAVAERHWKWKRAVNTAKAKNPNSYPFAVFTREGYKFKNAA